MELGPDAKLILEDGSTFPGFLFGAKKSSSGEVVFTTGMTGYPESMTDPSFSGQIVVFTYPLIGNYGVPEPIMRDGIETNFESSRIHVRGLVISDYCEGYSHWTASRSLGRWMEEHGVCGIYGIDTRELTKKLREKGVMLGKIMVDGDVAQYDPGKVDLVKEVTIDEPKVYQRGKKRVVLIDCGCKNHIISSFLKRDITVVRVPYDHYFLDMDYDGLFISNGPGDPAMCTKTIEHVQAAMLRKKPVFGICLGNQILGLAAGGKTYKLKYGHRSQNQPCIDLQTGQCRITSQNHGYAVDSKSLPSGWKEWFVNANDGTNEGIIHKKLPFMSVQFHPEATPGPTDTDYLFDKFVEMLK